MDTEYKGTERRKNSAEHICTKEDAIDTLAEDMVHVKSEIVMIKSVNERTIETLDRMETKLNSMDKRLFIDNGTLSIQTQLRDGSARMAQIEANIRATDAQNALNIKILMDKVEDVKNEPRKYAVYTIGLISLLGTLCGLIIWINANANQINTNTNQIKANVTHVTHVTNAITP